MFNLDEFTNAVFEDIRDGIPIIGSEHSSSMNHDDPFQDANGLADQYSIQSFSLPSSVSSAATLNTMFLAGFSDSNEGPSWDTVAPQSFPKGLNYLGRTLSDMPPAASPHAWILDHASVLSPLIAHTKRRMEDDGPSWSTSKCGRLDGMTAVERNPPSAYAYTGFSGYSGTHDITEGNALQLNNHSTRTSDGEKNFPIGSSVPVIEQSSAQGLWPMMTSTAATHRHPAWTPFMTAEYGGQPFPHPIDTQPLSAMPETSAQLISTPSTATEYGFEFSWPSITRESYTQPSQALPWGPTQQASRRPVQMYCDEMSFAAPGPSSFQCSLGSWPSSAVVDDAFPSISTPSMPSGYGQDLSFAPIVHHPHRGQPKAQRSRRGKSRQHPNQALRTSAADSQPLPSPVADSSFSIASQASSSSSSANTSNAALQKKGKKKAQTPFLLVEAKCHLCTEGFKRGSELHHHWTTNKHRLREREVENPGVMVTVDDLIPNCFCPSCGKGYTTPYVVKRHLKKCAGQEGSSQSGSQEGEGGSSGSTV